MKPTFYLNENNNLVTTYKNKTIYASKHEALCCTKLPNNKYIFGTLEFIKKVIDNN